MQNDRPLTKLVSANGSLADSKQDCLTQLVQEQWIQPNLCLSIVSHSHLLREALARLLQTDWNHRLKHSSKEGDTSDTADSISTAEKLTQHLVLLDYGIGRDLMIPSIQQWRSQHPGCYVVVVELKQESDLILDCIEAGAHGYVLQGASSLEIAQTIERVCRGEAHCSPIITAKLFERLAQTKMAQKNAQPLREKPSLTQREIEVLHYVAQGCSDREIAAKLVIEVRTVKHHVHNLLRKLHVKYRWQAAQLAIENGWLAKI